MSFELEKALREALQREEPSPDFTARVMARLAEQPEPEPVVRPSECVHWWQRLTGQFTNWFQMPQLQWVTAGALACVLLATAFGVRQYRERQREIAEGERAKEQVMLALQIASTKLNAAQRKVRQASERNIAEQDSERR
jgi:negative regulator of sigma E activity